MAMRIARTGVVIGDTKSKSTNLYDSTDRYATDQGAKIE
jgi:hypothetical protein